MKGGLWLEPKENTKRVVANRAMEGFVIIMLKIQEALIPCMWILGVVHGRDMDGMKGSLFGQLGFH
jgi:hypothetical protein